MTKRIPIVTDELLETLEARWRDQGAPIANSLRPGLTDDEIDERMATLGLTAPAEARTWWRWHDGASAKEHPSHDTVMIGAGWSFASLARAVTRTVEERERSESIEATAPLAVRWPDAWLVLSEDAHGGIAALDCSDPTSATTPVCSFDYPDPDPALTPGAPSLGELVTWWITALDDGTAAFDRVSGRWRYEWDRLDPSRRATLLI